MKIPSMLVDMESEFVVVLFCPQSKEWRRRVLRWLDWAADTGLMTEQFDEYDLYKMKLDERRKAHKIELNAEGTII